MIPAMAATSSTADNTAADSSPAVTPEASAPAAAECPAPPTGPDTSGFYRLQDKALQFAPNEVHAPDYNLSREDRQSLPLPHDGWQWFDSTEAAHGHHGLELPKPEAPAQEPKPGQPQLPRRKEGGRPERPEGR
jgi:hypothetical protein